jgi:hypothetical protein
MLTALAVEMVPAGQGLMPPASGLPAVPTALAVPTLPEPGQKLPAAHATGVSASGVPLM